LGGECFAHGCGFGFFGLVFFLKIFKTVEFNYIEPEKEYIEVDLNKDLGLATLVMYFLGDLESKYNKDSLNKE
jgi:hypothetical protein